MVCNYVQARRKVMMFVEQPASEPIKDTPMTKAEIDSWQHGMEHMMEEGQFTPAEVESIREKMKSAVSIQKKRESAGLDAMRYSTKRYEIFAGQTEHNHNHGA